MTEILCAQPAPDWIFLGEVAPVLKWLTGGNGPEEIEHQPVLFEKGYSISIERGEYLWHIQTPQLLPDIRIYIPNSDNTNEFSDWLTAFTRIMVFEQFPYQKDSTTFLLEQLLPWDSSVLAVLLDLPRRQSSTDITDSDEEIHKAELAYTQLGISVRVRHSTADLTALFGWSEPLSSRYCRTIQYDLYGLKHDISSICELYGQFEDVKAELIAQLDNIRTHTLISYQTVSHYRKRTLWENYSVALDARLFPDDVRKSIFWSAAEKIDQNIFQPYNLAFWNIEQDITILLSEIRSHLKAYLCTHALDSPCINMTEKDYQTEQTLRINSEFSVCCDSFFKEDLPCIIQDHLQRRYNWIENLCNKRSTQHES